MHGMYIPQVRMRVIGQIGSHRVSVPLRIELATGVMAVRSRNHVARDPIFVRTIQADPSSSITLDLRQCFPQRHIMRGDQSLVSAN
jgi:hypothetical protein